MRQAADLLDSSLWEANESVVERDRVDEEGLDCIGIPFGHLGHDIFTVEVTPYPKGYLRFCLRGRRDTLCHHLSDDAIVFDSGMVDSAPKKDQ